MKMVSVNYVVNLENFKTLLLDQIIFGDNKISPRDNGELTILLDSTIEKVFVESINQLENYYVVGIKVDDQIFAIPEQMEIAENFLKYADNEINRIAILFCNGDDHYVVD